MRSRDARSQRKVRRERAELARRISDWLDVPLSALSVVMLVLLVAQLTAPLDALWSERVNAALTAIWAVFAIDFAVELVVAPSKLTYLRANWITAVSVLLPAFRAVRFFRAVQLLRGISLVRLLTVLNRGTRAVDQVVRRGQFGYVLALAAIVTVTAAAGGYYFDQGVPGATIDNPADALWWAATLLTTINSHFEAVSLEARVIGFLLRIFGLVVSSYLTATIAVHVLGLGQHDNGQAASSAEVRELKAEVARLSSLVSALRTTAPAGEEDRRHAA